jgi:hypothetical protein
MEAVQGDGLAGRDAREEGSRAGRGVRIELIPRALALALVAAALTAAAAAARPWSVRTVPTPGASYSRGVDVLPSGRTAVLLQRRAGGRNRLELRLGTRVRTLDTASGGFLSTHIAHDSHGRLVVAWRRSLAPDVVQAFAWTSGAGRQQLSAVKKDVRDVTLAVAGNGRAAVAYDSTDGIFVARRSPGSGFSAAETVAPAGTFASGAGIAVTRRGRIVAAWLRGTGAVVRAADGAAPFEAAEVVPLRPPGAGTTLVGAAPKVVITSEGRAVVVVSSYELRRSAVAPLFADQRVEAFDWAAAAAHPSAASTLSRSASAGVADVVAQGASAVIAWTQRSPKAPRELWAATWTTKGVQRPRVYTTHALNSPVLLGAGARGAVQVFYRAGGPRWFNVRLTAAGLYRDTAVVTPPGAAVPFVYTATTGSRVAASWSVKVGKAWRTQVARPGQ